MAATTETAVVFNTGMAELSSKTIIAKMFTVLREETAA